MPAIGGLLAHGHPAGPVAGFGIRLLRRRKARGRCFAGLGVVAFVEASRAHEATRAIELLRGDTLAGRDPLRARNDFVPDLAIRLVVALKQAGGLLHRVGLLDV